MADLVTAQQSYSPDNRLSFQETVTMAARMKVLYGVSDLRAMKIVEETQAKRQEVLDERAKLAGGMSWSEMRAEADAEQRWAAYQPMRQAGGGR